MRVDQPFDTKGFIADKVWIFFWAVVIGYTGLTFWGYTDLRAENENLKKETNQQIENSVEKLEKKIDSLDASTDELKIKMVQNSEKINYMQAQQVEIMDILKDISKNVKKK